MFDADKTRMIGLPYVDKNYDDILSRFHLIPERHGHTDRQTDGRTDRQTDRIAISISRVSVLTRVKNLGVKLDLCFKKWDQRRFIEPNSKSIVQPTIGVDFF